MAKRLPIPVDAAAGPSPTTVTAAAAAAELGISLPTLYAYVSRGLLRSLPEAGTRRRHYILEDVWALKQRREQRRDPARIAEEALHWGPPVLESSISVIREGRLYYRGRDVAALAATCSLEQVAALLWCGDLDAPLPDALPALPSREWSDLANVVCRLPPLEALQASLAFAGPRDGSAYDTRPDAVVRAGVRMLRQLSAVAVRTRPSTRPAAEVMQRAWAPKKPAFARLIEAALILYADNGLNPSSFTVRCVASAGSTPYALVAAGLAALQGTKHGGACERAQALLEEAADARGASAVVEARLRRGEAVPGFGHPLYPEGDPRGRLLMQMVADLRPRSPRASGALALADAVRDRIGQEPNIDFGVVTLCNALDFPPGAALSLLGVGRSVGWVAHGLEQYGEGRPIRPRARYAGEPPGIPVPADRQSATPRPDRAR